MDDILTEDLLGEACLEQRDVIRLWVELAIDRVRVWEPTPCRSPSVSKMVADRERR